MNKLMALLFLPFCLGGESTRAQDSETELSHFLNRLLEVNGLSDSYEEIKEFMARVEKNSHPPCTLTRVSEVLDEPFCLERIALAMADDLEQASAAREWDGLLAAATSLIDVKLEPMNGDSPLPADEEPERCLERIEKTLDEASALRMEALKELSHDDIAHVHAWLPRILDKFIHHVYLEVDAEPDQLDEMKAALKELTWVDYGKMAEAARSLLRLVDPAFVKQAKTAFRRYREEIPKEAEEAGFSGDVAVYHSTPHGPIVIGGRRSTRYEGKAAFILDLGGDDTYVHAASTLDATRGLSMVIDADGDDAYLTSERGSLACALLGVSLLFDLAGDDRYEGTRMTQGFAGGGVALLFDGEGGDMYKGEEFAQGGALFGLGLLVDQQGNDQYDTYLYSQGFGLTRGLGALVDLQGDDAYKATGKYPCTYGMEGIFHAGSQGHGTGLRRYQVAAAPCYGGGIGLLLDGEGDDRFEAGNFSQGCGYFYGLGAFVDRSGDDWIEGTRYSQGTGAHQAAGIVIDERGDDEYHSKVAANQGGTWDMTVGMLLDYEGNDTYVAQDLAQGGAAQTAVALLFDGGGNDRYEAGSPSCQGGTGASEYHDKPSFAFFLDLGGGRDSYNRPEREDNKILMEKAYGLFVDLKVKNLASALKLPDKKLQGVWGAKEK